ncbi:putative pectinesterase [Medicago truncatula]|uniref:pectinesterase n=1 Tax=Medicago truncatula TaxID=3880 RepID=A0A072TUD3_MEDTR|nr:pectinesterase 3 [Medicago truncatula]KEH17170.1 plant invertase/pectin methylesterase inhibitor [Medicago truncatula]RHN66579.1 putative pectinesterase [Medicago truncatula]
MDSLKIFKGYDKVEENLEDPQKQQNYNNNRNKISKPLIATISIIITILFLTLTLSFTLFFHHNTNTESQKPFNSPNSIRSICNITRFRNSCFTALSSSSQNLTNPKTILKISILASINQLTELASSLKANSKGNAFGDCNEQIGDAVSRLNDSMSVVTNGAVTLTDGEVNDIQTWVSAALTDQQTCVDGLEEVGVSLESAGKVKNLMEKSNEYVSNSLAIVANIRHLLH